MERIIALIVSIIMMVTYSISEPANELPIFEPPQTPSATAADSTQASEETNVTLPEETTQHIHYYNNVSTQEATCTETGLTTYACKCGEKYHEETPALGHSWGIGTPLRIQHTMLLALKCICVPGVKNAKAFQFPSW